MSSLSADRKPPLDYGVQIRFIKDLDDTGGGYGERGRANGVGGGGGAGAAVTPPSSRYGVAVRVQGISGQPYVVLKDGEKGDSYGVQLKSHPQALSPVPPGVAVSDRGSSSSRSSPLPSLPSLSSPRPSPDPRSLTATPSSPEEEPVGRFGSPSRRPPGDGQAVGQGEAEERTAERPQRPAAPAPRRPPAVTNGVESKSLEGLTDGGLKKVGLKGIGREDRDSFPEPPPPVAFEEEPVQAIDTKSLAPINKLINRFNRPGTEPASTPPALADSQTQPRGRSSARARLRFDERRRSRSLDSRKDLAEDSSPRKSPSPTFNPYGPSVVSSSSSSFLASNPPYSSLGRKSATVAKATPVSAPKPVPFSQPPRKPPVVPKKPMTPDLLRNRSQSLELTNGEELDSKQTILSILKEGSTESEASLMRKAALIQERLAGLKNSNVDAELENKRLKQQLQQSQKDLQQANKQLAVVRREQEGAETRLQQQEDQLAHLQEELRGVSENTPHTETLQTELASVQAELSEAALQRQRLEESLRQRERELTALKGALKDEVASHDREMEALKEQYSQDLDTLRQSMENVSQTQQEMEDERERVNSSVMALEEELEGSKTKEQHWRTQLHSTSQELHKVQEEKKELEDRLKQMSVSEEKNALLQELQSCRDDLKRAQAELDQQRAESVKKGEELKAARGSSKEREEKLKAEIDSWKEQSQKNLDELEKALEKAKQAPVSSSPDLGTNLDLQEANTRLRERLARMSRLHSSSGGSSEAEQALEEENRTLRGQLDEARRGASRLGQERDELSRRLEEREREREALRRGKSDLEEQKRLLDRALEKINKEMELMMGDSRQSVQTLQAQLDEFRDRSRRDLQDAQRLSKDRLTELQRVQASNKNLQEEVSRLKRELLSCTEDRDSAQLDRDVMAGRLKHLESELESEKGSHSDRGREIRSLEDKVKSLEIELDEEKTGTELLNDRITRSREQVDQLRADLMQERSARHDLEMDKSAIERQVKELKSRVADMEGQSRPSAGHALLEAKVQELEERLRSEEREKASIQASQRRMERKLKEVNATLDQERHIHAEQRDQLLLRVKALKRQMDESEGEVERLEGVRRKALRELEEQQELQEALQAKVSTLEGELKRKVQQSRRPTLGPSTLSSDEEDGYYDNNSISSILTESQLQTTNC
ncbi:cingulin isoform X2 [Alosa pseudoharengus]|uniref:cingulin isoform X2 n=1 Tax=Alosa pseudoharengus TaxID=34774 RepID=UPI003F89623A